MFDSVPDVRLRRLRAISLRPPVSAPAPPTELEESLLSAVASDLRRICVGSVEPAEIASVPRVRVSGGGIYERGL